MDARQCLTCARRQYSYLDGKWTEWICWNCGMYESDTPAFKDSPQLFENVVRQNGKYFMEKYAFYYRRKQKVNIQATT